MSDEIDEIWALYADDGSQSLDCVESALAALRKDGKDAESVASLFRALHTFKGNSRLLGLSVIESCAHLAEDLVGLVRDDGVRIDAALLDLLLEASDKLREMMERTIVTRRDADVGHCGMIVARMSGKLGEMKAQLANSEGAAAPLQDQAPSGNVSEDEETFEIGRVFDPPTQSLAEDPVYRALFAEMANDAVATIRGMLLSQDNGDEQAFRPEIESAILQLRDAAARIELNDWVVIADDLAGSLESKVKVEEALARVEAYLRGQDAPAQPAPGPSDSLAEVGGSAFLAEIEPHLTLLCESIGQNGSVEKQTVVAACGAIQKAAARLGYMRVADCVARLPAASGGTDKCERLMFALHDDLRLIESLEVEIETIPGVARSRLSTLASWRLARMPAVVSTLAAQVAEPAEAIAWEQVADLLDSVYRACQFKGLAAAGEVSIVLTDLAARVASGEMPPDPSLLRVLKSFLEAAEGIFSSNGPESANAATIMTELLVRTGEVTAALSNKSSIQSIEMQLSLPESFQGALSAESAVAAEEAIASGSCFYIVRADIERHPELAAAFLEWTNVSGKAIGSVTVFDQSATLFDFLLASPLAPSDFQAGLKALDPSGAVLQVLQALSPAGGEPREGPTSALAAAESPEAPVETAATSVNMLESIGEIATGHATVRQLLGKCGEPDILAMIDAAVAAAGGNWTRARENVRRELDDWRENIEQSIQIESQLDNRLRQLQEDAVAVRMRPAATLLNALAQYGREIAAQSKVDAIFSIFNQDEPVDIDILEQLAAPMRALLDAIVELLVSLRDEDETNACSEIRISLARQVNRVVAALGSHGATFRAKDRARIENNLATIRRALGQAGGQLAAAFEEKSVRFDVSLPLSIAALPGMVVRVGDISYVVPINSIRRIVHSCRGDMIKVSADACSTFLKFGANEVAPIRFLSDSARERRGLFAPSDASDESKHLFVVVGDSGQCFALSVDELIGEQLVVIRPMKGYLSRVKHAMGCALLSNGGVGMVLDLAEMAA